VLDGVDGHRHAPGALSPGKEKSRPSYRRLSGPQNRYGQVRNISPPPAFDPRTIYPIASRYNSNAVLAKNQPGFKQLAATMDACRAYTSNACEDRRIL